MHRNVANLCVATDLNLLSVLQYAIEVLTVQHVIVCGHYGCGGVNAGLLRTYMGPISHWLCGIHDVHYRHYEDVEALPPDQQADRLCEWNMRDGVQVLAASLITQEA